MSMKEMKTLTIGEDIFEIVDEKARGDIETLKDDMPSNDEKQAWNNKSDFSGSYNDLTNKPTIPSKPQQVGADPSGTAESKVSSHNTSETSHNDIRLLIDGLTTRLNALANSDDTTLDQMAEVVTYIKNNKSLIDSITTNKVNVTDIIDNLTTSVSNKPLSAKQGMALKALIDAIKVPTKTSQLTNDSNFLTQHQDLSAYAKKSTTLSGYGITDGATKEQFNQLSNEKADKKNWTPNMIIGTDANGNMVARETYTEAEKQALMDEIIDNIKVEYPEAHVIYGDVDSENNIILYGDLPYGTYSLKYENEDGTKIEIGTLDIVKAIDYTIPLTWTRGKIDTSSGAISSNDAYCYSNLIDIEAGKKYTIALTNCTCAIKICYYDASEKFIKSSDFSYSVGGSGTIGSGTSELPMDSSASKFRIRTYTNWLGESDYSDTFNAFVNGAVLTWSM